MKIGIEVTGCLTEKPTGIANYIVSLYRELEKSPTECELEAFIWLSSFKNKDRLFRYLSPKRVSWHYKFYNFHKINNGLDIAHSTDAKFLNLPKTKKVVTVHDLAIFKREMADVPDYAPKEFVAKMRRNLERIAKKSDQIIAVSNQTKIDFLQMFPAFDERKIEPIHLAGSIDWASDTENDKEILQKFDVQPKSYFIFVGAISARKNLIRMIEAFKESGLSKETKFLLVGFQSMGADKIKHAIEKHGLKNRIILADYVAEKHIPALYRNSLGLAFATLYEGFGIPIIDAMLSRIPVMYGNLGAAPEVGNGLGIAVNPFSVGEIAAGFHELTKFKDERIEIAFDYAKTVTWKMTAKKTLEVYKSLL
jgi:glycosyltransferase involved in cell wall biosynthesis